MKSAAAVIALAAFVAGAAGQECEQGWTAGADPNGGCRWCYKTMGRNNWANAEAACEAEGAHLASIHSQSEMDLLKTMCTSRHGCWYGANDKTYDNLFEYTDGSYLAPNGAWDPVVIAPKTGGASRDCGKFKSNGNVEVSLCGSGSPSSVCKKPALTETQAYCLAFKKWEDKPCERGWIPSTSGMPACYHKIATGCTWNEGRVACEDAGAVLATFPDDDTRDAAYGVCARTQPIRCSIGLSDRAVEDRWVWEDASPVGRQYYLNDRKNGWRDCARMEKARPRGKIGAIGCDGQASTGNLRPLCRKGLTGGVSNGTYTIVTDAPGLRTGEHTTGITGTLEFANGQYTAGGDLWVVVTYWNPAGPALQWFRLHEETVGGDTFRRGVAAVANGRTVEYNLRDIIAAGSTLRLQHADAPGLRPGRRGVPSTVQWTNGPDATTTLLVPVGGLNNMEQLATPIITPGPGRYDSGNITVAVSLPEAPPGTEPQILYRLDGGIPADGDGLSTPYQSPFTLLRSQGRFLNVTARAFKAGFAASNASFVGYDLGSRTCPVANGIVCSPGPCATRFHMCVGGEATATRPVAPGTLCYEGGLVAQQGPQCSGENTPTATLPAPTHPVRPNNTGGPNPGIPGTCAAYIPTNACVGKPDEFYCADDCAADNTCLYQCQGGAVIQQLETAAGTVCAKGRQVNERGPVCGWAGPNPRPGDWYNCESAPGPGIVCGGQGACNSTFFQCGWGGFAPPQPVAPGTVCVRDPDTGRSSIQNVASATCPGRCGADLGFRCGGPTSGGSTCSYEVHWCSELFGVPKRGVLDLRALYGNATLPTIAPLICQARGGNGLDRVGFLPFVDCGSPAVPPYQPDVCASQPATGSTGATIVCSDTCSDTYSVCAGQVAHASNLPTAPGTLCKEGRLVHARTCSSAPEPQRLPVRTLRTRAAVDSRRSLAALGLGAAPAPATSLRHRALQTAQECIGLEVSIDEGAGGGFGEVAGQVAVADAIADVVAVPGAGVNFTDGAFVLIQEECGNVTCEVPTRQTLPVPSLPPSYLTLLAPVGSLQAPLDLPAGVVPDTQVSLAFDICGVAQEDTDAVVARLSAEGAIAVDGFAVAVPVGGITTPNATAPGTVPGGNNSGGGDSPSGINIPLVAGLSALAVLLVGGAAFFLWRRRQTPATPQQQDRVARNASQRLEDDGVELSDHQPGSISAYDKK